MKGHRIDLDKRVMPSRNKGRDEENNFTRTIIAYFRGRNFRTYSSLGSGVVFATLVRALFGGVAVAAAAAAATPSAPSAASTGVLDALADALFEL